MMTLLSHQPLGAQYLGGGRTRFLVWAPNARKVSVRLLSENGTSHVMSARADGYYELTLENVPPGSLYVYQLDDGPERPDPASRHQPHGVHGPSAVVADDHQWRDQHWFGLPLDQYVIYELHVGTFTPDGTFDAIIPRLKELSEIGITAIEIMPVAQFPGTRNWGYDGVLPSAVQNSYGGPAGLKRLVDACHAHGMAVVLDVVYNHLGPEGNYLSEFGPYFTDRYRTPWGLALNFDGAMSDHVRRYFIDSALYYVSQCHIDALRVDAVHSIVDSSATPFVQDLVDAVHQCAKALNRRAYVIAESAANDARIIRDRALGGIGFDAQWNDDFHHIVHVLLTGEQFGYYKSFGGLQQLAKAFSHGYVYTGEYLPFHGCRHGSDARDIPGERFVVFSQNHDQIGNRMRGERLSTLVSFESLKLAAGLVLLSPYVPLLFMGEEYGEPAPFLYFVSHDDAELIEAVRKGRRNEFAAFAWEGEPPDPQAKESFDNSALHWDLRYQQPHDGLLALYRELLTVRKTIPALANLNKNTLRTSTNQHTRTLALHRWHGTSEALALFNLSQRPALVAADVSAGRWVCRIDSRDTQWRGPGSSVPEAVESGGRVEVNVPGQAFVLYVVNGEA